MVPGCPNELAQMARPLGSTRTTRLRRCSRPVRQQAPRRYSAPRGCRRLRALPLAATPCSRQCRGLPSHVLRKSRRPGSRRLHAGHHLASRRAPARLLLRPDHRPSFAAVSTTFDTSAAIRSRSPSRSPPDTLPRAFSSTLTTLGVQPSAARGGLEPPPAGRPQRASNPPSPAQHRIQQGHLPHRTFPSALVAQWSPCHTARVRRCPPRCLAGWPAASPT